jgi:hypothetical protein
LPCTASLPPRHPQYVQHPFLYHLLDHRHGATIVVLVPRASVGRP